MAYVPLKTWADGDVLLAADLQGELDNVRTYVSKVEETAFVDGPFIDSKHVVRGEYDPVTNQARMVSGIYGGTQSLNNTRFTYGTGYNTRKFSTQDVWEYVPLTSLTLEVRRPVSVLINWWASVRSSDDTSSSPPTGVGEIRLFIGNPGFRTGELCRVVEDDFFTGDLMYRNYRSIPGGFFMDDFPSGTYEVGLCAQATAAKVMFHAWGLSVEAFAM